MAENLETEKNVDTQTTSHFDLASFSRAKEKMIATNENAY